jgi:hypothetical protein
MTKPPSPPAWTITGLRAERAEATLDLAAPQIGLVLVATPDRLLGVDLALPAGRKLLPSDHWVRGEDLVAVYEPDDPRKIRATAMWRRLTRPDPGWALVVSAQTSLLESDPKLAVISDLASGRVAWGRCAAEGVEWTALPTDSPCPTEAECLLVERQDNAVVLAVHPADARRLELVWAGDRLRVLCWLFAAEIEKGVLLRSRVRAGVGPAGAVSWASSLMLSLAAEPPPLTT